MISRVFFRRTKFILMSVHCFLSSHLQKLEIHTYSFLLIMVEFRFKKMNLLDPEIKTRINYDENNSL